MKLRRLLVGVVLLASAVNVLAAREPRRPINLPKPVKTGAAVAVAAFVGYNFGKLAGKFPKWHFGESLTSCFIGLFTLKFTALQPTTSL